MRNNRYILILSSLALVFGCTREHPEPIERLYGEPIPYSVSVDAGPLTRVAFDGSAINSGDYEFASGDQLYISDAEGNISGILDITSGVGSSTATFDGELIPVPNFTPTDDTDLTITLVGTSQTSFFTISGGRITGAPTYPSTIPASTPIADLVQNYSHFTTNVKYGVRSYTLHQQTVFLNFRLELMAISITGSPSNVDVKIKSADGNTTLRTVSGVTVGGNASIANLEFTTIFPAGTSLQGAQIVVDNGSGIHCTPDFASDLTLEANKYYSVSRTNVEPFTVEAPSSGTGATITPQFQNLQYRISSGDGWTDWEDCPASITLSAGEKINLRGKGTSYSNNSGSQPLFTTTNPVNIYGDIMYLMCDANWDHTFTVGNKAFYRAFKDLPVDIPADKDLLLSALTLGTSCYEGMFNGCTSLTKAPILPATIAAAYCYKSMFSGCSAMTTPPPSLPATTLNRQAYYQMFYNCTALTSIPDFPCDSGATYTLYSGTADKDGICYQMFYGCNALTTLAGKRLFNSSSDLGNYCFQAMFANCTSLTTVASDFLPATTSATSCYRSMFEGCTALTTGPSSLPITTVEESACLKMFYGCTSLTSAPEFSNSLSEVKASGCSEMFSGCSNMTAPPSKLPAGTLRYKAYYKMFWSCSKLESIPDFPCATGVTYTLTEGNSAENGSQDGLCYQMFYNCNALTSLEGKKLFNSDTPLKLGCFNDMFSTCANLKTVPEDFLPAITLAASCYRGMFQQCSNLTRAPALLAPTLQSKCYQYMFNKCTSLVYIKCYSTSPGSTAYTQNWLQNAKNTSECTFHYRSGVTWPSENTYGIPKNWTDIGDIVP